MAERYKYIQKVKRGDKVRYFYSNEEYEAYKRGLSQAQNEMDYYRTERAYETPRTKSKSDPDISNKIEKGRKAIAKILSNANKKSTNKILGAYKSPNTDRFGSINVSTGRTHRKSNNDGFGSINVSTGNVHRRKDPINVMTGLSHLRRKRR